MPMVQLSLSKSRVFFPIKTSLMVPGLSMLPYLGYVLPRFLMVEGYLCRFWYRGQPLFAIFVPFRATDRQTALTRTSAESVGKPGTFLGIVPLTGQRETADFPPLALSSQSAEASVSRDSSDSQLLKNNELDLL